ncbi:MAG: I78 family peptidase inhibitor [Yoonia sp.]|nr:I78 family peptidase inhibitor [Yoonia sp.]
MKKLMILMVVAACAKSPTQPNATPMKVEDRLPVGIDDSCGAKRYHTLLDQNATALERILIMGQVRVVRPGTISTQDYRPARMNFHVGDNGKITRISCG